MKVIIVEGIDNVGKTTMINRLADIYHDKYKIMYLHCGACPDFVDFAQRLCQINDIDIQRFEKEKEVLAIIDRAWTGEYVYGPIYRHKDRMSIIKMFFRVGTALRKSFTNVPRDFYEIFVYASPEFAIKHDDNLSLSSDLDYEKRVKRIQWEIDSFKEASKINPLFLNNEHRKEINVEAEEYNFKSIDDIIKELNLPEEL